MNNHSCAEIDPVQLQLVSGSKLVGIVPGDQYWSSACPATVLERSWSRKNALHRIMASVTEAISNLPTGGYAPLTEITAELNRR